MRASTRYFFAKNTWTKKAPADRWTAPPAQNPDTAPLASLIRRSLTFATGYINNTIPKKLSSKSFCITRKILLLQLH